MKKISFYISLLLFVTVLSCKKENNRVSNNIAGKIKSIKILVADSTAFEYNFFYKHNGLLDTLILNGHRFIIDSIRFSYNNLNQLSSINFKSVFNEFYSYTPYHVKDSMLLRFNTNGFLEYIYANKNENDICRITERYDTIQVSNENISNHKYSAYVNGCTDLPEIWNFNFEYYYNNSINSDFTNENVGMPYFGKSNKNAIDSISFKYSYYKFGTNYYEGSIKCKNIYDQYNRIIKTNIIPINALSIFYFGYLSPLVRYDDNLYEITYY
jgi:hypothetical protein